VPSPDYTKRTALTNRALSLPAILGTIISLIGYGTRSVPTTIAQTLRLKKWADHICPPTDCEYLLEMLGQLTRHDVEGRGSARAAVATQSEMHLVEHVKK
jgi:hypothetical protein